MNISHALTACFSVVLLSTSALHAQTPITWSGATSNDFATDTNWVGDVAPANNITANTAVFGSVVTPNEPVLTGNRSVYGLTFQSTTGGWDLGGSGVLSIGGNNTAGGINDLANTSGTTTINPTISFTAGNRNISSGVGGTLRLDGGISISGARQVIVDSGTVVVSSINAANTTSNFQKSGAGTLVVSGTAGANFSSSTSIFTLSAGTVIVGNKGALGGGSLSLGAGVMQASTDLSGPNAMSFNGITIANSVTISGSHSITLGGPVSFADSRTITNNIVGPGKTLELTGAIANSAVSLTFRQFRIDGTGTTLISGNINDGTNGAAFRQLGSGLTILSGTNAYTGNTFAAGGILQIAKVSALYNGNSANWQFSQAAGANVPNIGASGGATLAFNVGGEGEFTAANITTILTNSASGGNPGNAAGMGSGTFFGFDTTNAAGGVFTITDNMALDTGGGAGGSVGVRKLGTNTLILSGNNTYTGSTNVEAGTLLVNGSVSANSTVSVAGGAGFGRGVAGALDVGADAVFADNSIIVLGLGSGFTNSSLNRTGGSWVFDNNQAFTFSDLGGAAEGMYTGLITGLTGSEAGLASIGSWTITNAGWSGTFSYDAGSVNLNLAAIPEPSTYALIFCAILAGLFIHYRRRRLE